MLSHFGDSRAMVAAVGLRVGARVADAVFYWHREGKGPETPTARRWWRSDSSNRELGRG